MIVKWTVVTHHSATPDTSITILFKTTKRNCDYTKLAKKKTAQKPYNL